MENLKFWTDLRQKYQKQVKPSEDKKVRFNFADQHSIEQLSSLREQKFKFLSRHMAHYQEKKLPEFKPLVKPLLGALVEDSLSLSCSLESSLSSSFAQSEESIMRSSQLGTSQQKVLDGAFNRARSRLTHSLMLKTSSPEQSDVSFKSDSFFPKMHKLKSPKNKPSTLKFEVAKYLIHKALEKSKPYYLGMEESDIENTTEDIKYLKQELDKRLVDESFELNSQETPKCSIEIPKAEYFSPQSLRQVRLSKFAQDIPKLTEKSLEDFIETYKSQEQKNYFKKIKSGFEGKPHSAEIVPSPPSELNISESHSLREPKIQSKFATKKSKTPVLVTERETSNRSAKSQNYLIEDLVSRPSSTGEVCQELFTSFTNLKDFSISEEPELQKANFSQNLEKLFEVLDKCSIGLMATNVCLGFYNVLSFGKRKQRKVHNQRVARAKYEFTLIDRGLGNWSSYSKTAKIQRTKSVDAFKHRWGLVKLYMALSGMRFVCRAHKKWIEEVRKQMLVRKAKSCLGEWKFLVSDRKAHSALSGKKLKRSFCAFKNYVVAKKHSRVQGYLTWYTTAVKKAFRAMKLTLDAKKNHNKRVLKARKNHRQKLLYKVFSKWSNYKTLIESNYIPIRISKKLSISKTNGKLRSKQSFDIKIVKT